MDELDKLIETKLQELWPWQKEKIKPRSSTSIINQAHKRAWGWMKVQLKKCDEIMHNRFPIWNKERAVKDCKLNLELSVWVLYIRYLNQTKKYCVNKPKCIDRLQEEIKKAKIRRDQEYKKWHERNPTPIVFSV